MKNKIDISGLDKAQVLAELYNNAAPLGYGWLVASTADMTKDEAQLIIDTQAENLYFDYLKGRILKVDLSGNQFDPNRYDRDQGQGRAAKVIENIRNNSIPSEETNLTGVDNTSVHNDNL